MFKLSNLYALKATEYTRTCTMKYTCSKFLVADINDQIVLVLLLPLIAFVMRTIRNYYFMIYSIHLFYIILDNMVQLTHMICRFLCNFQHGQLYWVGAKILQSWSEKQVFNSNLSERNVSIVWNMCFTRKIHVIIHWWLIWLVRHN